jgi:hypothetical protein
MARKTIVIVLALGLVMLAAQALPAAKKVKPGPDTAAWYAKRQQIRADWRKHCVAMLPLFRQLKILKLELKILLLRDKVNLAAIKAKIKQIAAQKGKIMLQGVMFRLQMRRKYPKVALYRSLRRLRRGWRARRPGAGMSWRGRSGHRRRPGYRRGPGYHMGPGHRMGPGYMMMQPGDRGGTGPMR